MGFLPSLRLASFGNPETNVRFGHAAAMARNAAARPSGFDAGHGRESRRPRPLARTLIAAPSGVFRRVLKNDVKDCAPITADRLIPKFENFLRLGTGDENVTVRDGTRRARRSSPVSTKISELTRVCQRAQFCELRTFYPIETLKDNAVQNRKAAESERTPIG